MFRIGDFAKLAQISTHRLRNYDKQGLLPPAHIDQQTGYRYYSAEQLGRLNRIIALRGLGLSLEGIKAALIANINTEQMEQMLLQRQVELEHEIALKAEQLQQVHNRLHQIKEESPSTPHEIVVKPLPTYVVASIRMIVKHRSEVSYYCNALHPEIHQALAPIGIKAELPTINLYHNDDLYDKSIDLEACVVVAPEALEETTNTRVQFRQLAGATEAASLLFSEDYSQFEAAILALAQWVELAGYRVAGALREVHHSPMVNKVKSQTGKPVVELQVPIEKIHA
ncbi:MAG: MerR family transcriptional regulator [Chloroflexota bacterium]